MNKPTQLAQTQIYNNRNNITKAYGVLCSIIAQNLICNVEGTVVVLCMKNILVGTEDEQSLNIDMNIDRWRHMMPSLCAMSWISGGGQINTADDTDSDVIAHVA